MQSLPTFSSCGKWDIVKEVSDWSCLKDERIRMGGTLNSSWSCCAQPKPETRFQCGVEIQNCATIWIAFEDWHVNIRCGSCTARTEHNGLDGVRRERMQGVSTTAHIVVTADPLGLGKGRIAAKRVEMPNASA